MSQLLRSVIEQNRSGATVAIPSVCSAQPDVLRASLMRAAKLEVPLVVEATSNQVNHYGGYTGMQPKDFVAFVLRLAEDSGFSAGQMVLGGDHLGPQVWRSGSAEEAMAEAERMVSAYVEAGFTKIHLDCSEGCAGEPAQVDEETAAARAAALAKVCLEAAPDPDALMFVIGTEVPPPGGARTDDHGDIRPTTVAAAKATLAAHQKAFDDAGLSNAWPYVGGLVVQPGVEFTPMNVHHLPYDKDPGLKEALAGHPNICLEAHSTDYQLREVYERLADMGFAFQKVGPALTFAWREAIYSLDAVARIAGLSTADVPGTMETIMTQDPKWWQGHYHGTDPELRIMRHVGLADRIRYYWPQEKAQAAVKTLLKDLERASLPDPLLSQVFSTDVIERAKALRANLACSMGQALVYARVQAELDPYFLGRDQ